MLVLFMLGKSKIETFPKPKYENITNFRLPLNIIPERYYLSIQPYLMPENLKFDGNVEIILECREQTNVIILHIHNLSIAEKEIELQSLKEGNNIKLYSINFKPEFDFLILKFLDNLKKNYRYRLSINFSGKLRSDCKGFHISSYKENNITHRIALTHFEPFHARKTFPCFDEPALKANFDITIIRWINMTSLSNMPKLKTIFWDNDWEADIFNTSLRMSTYSLSFFIGRYLSSRSDKITVWYPPKHSNVLTTTLNLGPKFLKFYEDILKVPYPIPKLDLVSVLDWPPRAMENWGLIISSSELIYNERYPLISKHKIISKILAHEIAHQWFGNLVTPKWWNDIWLNEGISTFMEHVANMALFPELNKIDKTLLTAAKKLYPKDCFDEITTVSISDKLDISSFEDNFDDFIYIKGAVITRMARYIFGDEVFWNGLSRYLKENSYKNVEEKDFWNYLIRESKSLFSDITKMNIPTMENMLTWTQLKGMPIVSANRNYAEGTVFLSQVSCRKNKMKELEKDLWHIPISYITPVSPTIQKKSSNVEFWLKTRNATMDNLFINRNDWLLLNDQSQGYFVVNYDSRNWKLLAKQLKKDPKTTFTNNQRFKLLVDVAILLDLNYLDWDLALDIYSYIHNERELSVLQFRVFEQLQKFTELIEHNEYEDIWKEFLIYILEPIYTKIGWNYDLQTDPNFRDIYFRIVQQLCDIGYEPCVKEALKRFNLWKLNKNNEIDTIYHYTILCMGIKYGTKTDWEELYEIFEDDETEDVISSLACSKDADNIQRLLEIAYDEDTDITQFVPIVQGILRNDKLWYMFYDFLDENFKDFIENRIRYQFMLAIKDQTEVYNPVKYSKFNSICIKNVGETKKMKGKVNTLLKFNEETVSRMNLMLDKIIEWLKEKSWTRKN